MMGEFCNRDNAGNNYLTCAPIRPQVKLIFWDDYKALIPKALFNLGIVEIREAELIIRIKWTADPSDWTALHLISMEVPERFEGPMWHGVVVDEIADCKVKAWKQHLYPALADSGAWCILLGVPEGVSFYREYLPYCKYNYKQTEGKMEATVTETGNETWTSFTWFSSLVLPADVIAEYKRTMDERTYRQEYEGFIDNYVGQLYYTFDKDVNVNDSIAKHEPDKPIWLSCDFNKAPMVWEVAQDFTITAKQKVYSAVKFIDEISLSYGAKTQHNVHQFIKRYEDHKNRVLYLTGDATDNYESHRDYTTDYILIRDELKKADWKVVDKVPTGNAGINNRVNIVCSLLRSASGIIRMYINNKCRYLIMDLEKNESDNKGAKDKDDPLQTHGSDAMDYKVWEGFSREFYNIEVKQL